MHQKSIEISGKFFSVNEFMQIAYVIH